MNIPVLLNHYIDDSWDHPRQLCTMCKQPATVAVLTEFVPNRQMFQLCGTCLNIIQTSIHRAILPDAGRVPEDLK